VGVFPFSREEGTHADGLDDQVPLQLIAERIDECTELQDAITRNKREMLIGRTVEVLVDAPGRGRTVREAPEIDGVVSVPDELPTGTFADLIVVDAEGPDLVAEHRNEAGRVGRRVGTSVASR
jgi:ribosomal protein S12 methylthiotransferase